MHHGLALRSRTRRQLRAGRNLNEYQPGRVAVVLLQRPGSEDVAFGRPLESAKVVELQRGALALGVLDQLPSLGVADQDSGVRHLSEVLAVGAPQEMWEVATAGCDHGCSALPHAPTGQDVEDGHRGVRVGRRVATVPHQNELFVGREVNLLDIVHGQAHLLLEIGASPESDTLLMERSHVRALRRPEHTPIAPHLAGRLLGLATITKDWTASHSVVPVDLGLGNVRFRVAEQDLLSALLVA
mmetsp:Transcript_31339/g.99872  ORF Transcript_31339/g.99872 Transcript_31339/m.99872 type:complete len:242 (-) Transcript_31339:566-1291(-)